MRWTFAPLLFAPTTAAAAGLDPGAWTQHYAAQRAGYYLADARKMLEKAMRHYSTRHQGKGEAPDPYLKVWDAQSQLSAALSWDNSSAELWLEAGNVTFTLAGLMREIQEGDLLQDALNIWAQALRLESHPDRPLARRLWRWLRDLAEAPAGDLRKRLPQRLWQRVRRDAWAEVQLWEEKGGRVPPGRLPRLRRQGRVEALAGAAAGNECATGGVGAGEGWLQEKLGAGRQLLFPTFIFRANVLQELGKPAMDRLSATASAKYAEFRKKHRDGAKQETRVNDAFFQFQETHERALHSPEATARWPELYRSDDFRQLQALARNASLAYLRHSGTEASPEELKSSWVILWAAVYPQDPKVQARHGWHTHQESIVSGVLYAAPQRTPLLFADPRGAPPIEDYEQYRDGDLLFEPKAPFDAHYQFFAEQGDLVVFPSWLVHKVPPQLGAGRDGFRVVFPFNFHLGNARRSHGTIWDGWERTVQVRAEV